MGVQRSTLTAVALVSLLSFALLASLLAHGHGSYSFEHPLLRSLGSPSSVSPWADFADLIAAPAIIAVLLATIAYGAFRRSLVRVVVYAAFAGTTLLFSEHVAKPLVHETYAGHLTFPSGNVTAVCATAVAMWCALHPLIGKWNRGVWAVLGAAWVLLMSMAVVGAHWHTPFDALGSVLLSTGIIAAGGAIFERHAVGGRTWPVDPDDTQLGATDDVAMQASAARGLARCGSSMQRFSGPFDLP